MRNRLEVLTISVVVRSPRRLPIFEGIKEHPYPDLFQGIYAIEWHVKAQNLYRVHCSSTSVFTVAGDLFSMAELWEKRLAETEIETA